jgi:hypothetical protein
MHVSGQTATQGGPKLAILSGRRATKRNVSMLVDLLWLQLLLPKCLVTAKSDPPELLP